MQWLEGTPLSDTQQIEARGIDLATVARNGAEMYLEMIFRHGVYHADPHPGNLLLMKNNTIGLLDFGMVGRIDEALRENIEDLLLAMVQQDSLQLGATVMRVGAVPLGLDEASLAPIWPTTWPITPTSRSTSLNWPRPWAKCSI